MYQYRSVACIVFTVCLLLTVRTAPQAQPALDKTLVNSIGMEFVLMGIIVHVDYHRPYPAPVWHVHYDTHHTQKTRLRIEVAPHHGDVYVNDRYLGQAHTFRNGSVQVALPAGKHTVQLRYGGTSYTRQVHVKTGATAVVQTHRM